MANGLFNLKQVIQAVQQGGWPAQKTPAVEYLVVAGGGSGGWDQGGGGGAGGLLTGLDPVPNGQTLLVTIGGGGAGVTSGRGNNGDSSVFGSISTTGGGGAGQYSSPPGTANLGKDGGSGGGGGGSEGALQPGGQGTFGQGNAGGRGNNNTGSGGGGAGGGGAGTVGLDAGGSGGTGGNGGAGIASAISGTVTAYAGGGGGNKAGSTAGIGGVGGGGAASNSTTVAGTAGTANTGGGGGGVWNTGGAYPSGAGGSGIVIVSYPDVYAAPTATTGSPTVSTSGSGSILFNGSTQYLQYPDSTAYDFGSGDFTIEAWIYVTGSGRRAICGQADSGGADANTSFTFQINGGGYLVGAVVSSSTTYSVGDPSSFATNQWVNVAFVRDGTVLRLYKAGVQVATTTAAVTVNNSAYRFGVGSLGEYVATGLFGGNITNLRIVKGTCLYPSGTTYTPSTTPLTVVSGTSILLSAASGAFTADSSTNSFAPNTASVSPTWNAASPFTGTGYKNRVYTWTTSGTITF